MMYFKSTSVHRSNTDAQFNIAFNGHYNVSIDRHFYKLSSNTLYFFFKSLDVSAILKHNKISIVAYFYGPVCLLCKVWYKFC